METHYDEQLIMDFGLNVKICQGIHFIDLLRLEYNEEITQTFGFTFLDSLIKNTNFILLTDIPDRIPDYCIILFPNWSVFLKSRVFYQSIFISPVQSIVNFKIPVQNLPLNCTHMISYKILGLISLYLSLKNPKIFIETFNKFNLQEIAITSTNNIKEFILLSSKIPVKTLQMDIEEAKDILKNHHKKKFLVLLKPIMNIYFFQEKKFRNIDVSLYEIGENSESLEYSPTHDMNEFSMYTGDYLKGPNKVPSFIVTEHQITEDYTQKKSQLELNESTNSYKVLPTPLNSPKQSSFTIVEIKQKMQYGGSNQETCDKNSVVTEGKSFDGREICACSFCVVY
ncbi:hypothetical protein SteCoe_35285 [Stentor coeruleus]|uniref:Uncharacterized protein n=1 Tax=Stentor coeruleus TaxID=5963 RepID=A0A1R2ASL0_9CILI|nr:hypothetical protein SteCoe_35285 [Stentor coeruleus]